MIRFSLCLALLGLMAGRCLADDQANDPVRDALEKAKATYTEGIEKAKTDLRAAFDTEIQEVAKTGNLEHVKNVQAQKKAFDTEGKLPAAQPMKKAAADYQAAVDTTRKTFMAAYETAISDYTKKLKIDKAESTAREYDDFKNPSSKKPPAETIAKIPSDVSIKVPEDSVAYKGHHYKYFDDKLTWYFAKAKCEKMGGHLICIADSDEDSLAIGLVKKAQRESAWIGASDEEEKGIWRWINGEPFSYTHWGPDQPDNFHGWETCLEIHTYPDGTKAWNDLSEGARQGFICEWDR